MLTVYNVADFFINLAKYNDNDTITNMRINKLVYFAQVWHLVRYNNPLFLEEIQAWDYGPVIPALYQKYKSFGKNNIDIISSDYSSDIFSEDELNILLDVYSYYSKFSTTELVNITHKEGCPWYMIYMNNNVNNNTISNDSLKEFYQHQEPLESFTLPEWIYKDVEIPKRNQNGVILLTSDDWEDDDA